MTSDIVSEIKARCSPDNYNLQTAEGRAMFDNDLIRELQNITDKRVGFHAKEMLREWRDGILRNLRENRSSSRTEIMAILPDIINKEPK